MASFAKLNSNNIVEQVLSVHNNELLDNGIESEQKGINFLKNIFGQDTNWKQTSYNTKSGKHYLSDNFSLSDTQEKAFRKNHAAIGYIYDAQRDAFIGPKPYNSWVLDEVSGSWKAPISKPDTILSDEQKYIWNEEIGNWQVYPPIAKPIDILPENQFYYWNHESNIWEINKRGYNTTRTL